MSYKSAGDNPVLDKVKLDSDKNKLKRGIVKLGSQFIAFP